MHRFITLSLICLLVLFTHACPALADFYELINDSGNTLKVQSKAIKVTKPIKAKPVSFSLAAGERKLVDFGEDCRIWSVHLCNAANMGECYKWDRQPKPMDPDRNWRIVVKPGVKVTITEKK